MHPYLLELLGDNVVAHYAYEGLRDKWPQFNERSKIYHVQHGYEVNILNASTARTQMRYIDVAISGWRKLKWYLFAGPTLKQLDDPKKRQEYTADLWKSFCKAPTYAFWRIAGRLFRKPAWVRRGIERQPSPYMELPEPTSTTIRLERFGYTKRPDYDYYTGKHRSPRYDEDMIQIACGYHPATDTLYIRRLA